MQRPHGNLRRGRPYAEEGGRAFLSAQREGGGAPAASAGRPWMSLRQGARARHCGRDCRGERRAGGRRRRHFHGTAAGEVASVDKASRTAAGDVVADWPR